MVEKEMDIRRKPLAIKIAWRSDPIVVHYYAEIIAALENPEDYDNKAIRSIGDKAKSLRKTKFPLSRIGRAKLRKG